MTASDLALPTKACHNCRKKRWKCDRSLPVCHKCLSSGAECLGYGKLFVWNNGVASRGKMMGKSYEEALATRRDGQAHLPRLAFRPTPAPTPKPSSQPEHYPGLSHPADPDYRDDSSSSSGEEGEHVGTVVQRPLLDPLVQDLSSHSRYYLSHFASQLCADMVCYDAPGQNPLRELIPATSAYPLLLQIMIASSAFHVFNISQDPMSQSVYQQTQKPCLMAYYQAVSRFGGPLKSSYHDALVAKQQALSLMAKSVASVNSSNIDMILVAILLFVNYDLIESGRDKWKVHMEGARKLINLLGTPAFEQRPMSKLRQYVLSDLLIFSILGSTFTFSVTPKLIPDTVDIEPILRYAESNNYLSCPAPLLRIMLESFALSDTRNSPTDDVAADVQERVGSMIMAVLAFDPVQWAHDFEPTSELDDVRQRILIASAHRSAVCIYLARIIPCNNPLLDPESGSALVSLTALADDIVLHISKLRPGDSLFKSISWPLFLAGAESEDVAQREWIMNTLDEFYNVMYWGYVKTVKSVLEEIWKFKDRAGAGSANCWVVEVKEMGTELLIA